MINIVKFVCVKVYMTICVPKCSEFLNSNFEAFVLEALAFRLCFGAWRCLVWRLPCLGVLGEVCSVCLCFLSYPVSFCSCFDMFCRAPTHVS